jgi:c-di-AMP phosphodiesterase-like protein
MKNYEVTVSKVVYRLIDEFESEDQARAFAISQRDLVRELDKDSRVEYFYDVEEAGE